MFESRIWRTAEFHNLGEQQRCRVLGVRATAQSSNAWGGTWPESRSDGFSQVEPISPQQPGQSITKDSQSVLPLKKAVNHFYCSVVLQEASFCDKLQLDFRTLSSELRFADSVTLQCNLQNSTMAPRHQTTHERQSWMQLPRFLLLAGSSLQQWCAREQGKAPPLHYA